MVSFAIQEKGTSVNPQTAAAPTGGGSVAIDLAEQGHNDLVGQPHEQIEEGPVAEAEAVAARISTEDKPMGTPGRRFNRKSPFFIGMTAAAGVAVTYGAIQLLTVAGNVLILIGLALFLAVGMEPAVSFLANHRWPRPLGVAAILLLILGVIGGFTAAAIPALITQGQQLIADAPHYLQQAQNHSSFIGKLDERLHLTQKLQSLISSPASIDFHGVLSAGAAVFSAITDTFIVLVLTAYFLADMPRIRALIYRLVPHTRRPRVILMGDDILAKVGTYVLGNLLISLIAGGLTFGWLMIFSVPYAALLSIMVALFDLVPVVGSTIAGIIVAAAALTISLPICLATIAFFIIYRGAEDYFLIPRIIGRAVKVPALVTVVAVLIGGALLGVIGALVAIPAAAAILLITREIVFPRLDET
jgi:predicted PurR-regulated permease PerM